MLVDPSIFQPFAQKLLSELADLPDDEARVAHITTVLVATFNSGSASAVTGAVSAIQAVEVPSTGFVVFRFPVEADRVAFAPTLGTIRRTLAARRGYDPIILALRDDVDVAVVKFGDNDEATEPTPEQLRAERGSFTAAWLRGQLLVEFDRCLTEVRVTGGSRTDDGQLRHSFTVLTVPSDPDVGMSMPEAVAHGLRMVLRPLAVAFDEAYEVSVIDPDRPEGHVFCVDSRGLE